MIGLIDAFPENERIIPFEFELYEGKEILIRVLPCLSGFAELFETRYENNYCSREAIDEIRNRCTEIITPLGFCEDISSTYCIYKYSSDETLIIEKFVRSDSRIIKDLSETKYDKRILFDVRECVRDGGIAAVTLDNCSIVSVAAANMSCNVQETPEITTETAVGYRGMGLASSNVASVILELKRMGKSPVYKCRSTNYSSVSVAENLGLKREKITYRYLGVRKNIN